MSDLQQKLQADILDRLKGKKGQRQTRSDFNKAANTIKKQFKIDGTAIEQAIETLLSEQYVSRTTRGTYQLETKGVDYLARLELALTDPPSEINDALLPYQKAFVLMKTFCSKGKRLTRSEIGKKINTDMVKRALLFARMNIDPPVNPDNGILDWVIAQLVKEKDLHRTVYQGKPSYTLTPNGMELLVASEQYPKLRFTFTLTSEQFKELLDLARTLSPAEPVETPPQPQVASIPSTATVPTTDTGSVPVKLTVEMVTDAFEELRREKYARNGIVPVFELRRLLIARHGTESGSHAALDPLLKQMRREKQLRMIAIGDLSEATTEQLDDSVPGENETFFYLETAHEHAHV